MSRRPLTLLTICAFICATPLCMTAQNGEYEVIRTTKDSDFQPRADVEFEFPLADDLSFIINNEIRFMDNCTRVDRNYLLGAFSWETCDYFSIDAGYIFQSLLTEGDIEYRRQWQYRHRVYLDLKAQVELGVDYEIPKTDLEPYAFFELSNTLNTVNYGGGPFVDRLRFCLGISWEVSDFNSIELYYYFDIRNSRDVSFTHGSDGSLYNIFLNKERQYLHILGLSFNFGWD